MQTSIAKVKEAVPSIAPSSGPSLVSSLLVQPIVNPLWSNGVGNRASDFDL